MRTNIALLTTLAFLTLACTDSAGLYTKSTFQIPNPGTTKIEIISPKYQQLFPPESEVVIEADVIPEAGKAIRNVYISGDGIDSSSKRELPEMQLISEEDGIFRYRYSIAAAQANTKYSNVVIQVVDSSGTVSRSGQGYLVKHLPEITITSLKDGQIFPKDQKIPITMRTSALDLDNEYTLFVDEKYLGRMVTSETSTFFWLTPKVGSHTIQIVVTFDGVELTKSAPIGIEVR